MVNCYCFMSWTTTVLGYDDLLLHGIAIAWTAALLVIVYMWLFTLYNLVYML